MKKLIIILLLLSFPCIVSSQTGWTRFHTGVIYNPYSLTFVDSLNGMILYGNTVYVTFDGGISWSMRNIQLTGTCFSLSSAHSGVIFACGYYSGSFNYGFIAKTTNLGVTWSETQIFDNYFNDIYFIDNNTGYCAGKYGVIVKTTNSGAQWFNIGGMEEYSQIFNCIYFTSPDTGYIGNEYGRIYKTFNGGYNWLEIPAYPLSRIKSLVFPSLDTGYCAGYLPSGAGYKSNFYKTTNRGSSWQCIDTLNYVIFDVFFTSSNTGYHSGQQGQIAKTTNGGVTWNYQSSTVSTDLTCIYFLNNNTGFIGGSYDVLLKTLSGGEYVVSTGNSSITAEFNLSQNYPNPFNPQTKIKFAVPSNVKGQTSNVKLFIYDLLGREVATLVNEELKPGTYEADWDGSNFSSGVYFYKIVSDNFVETRKMVLMK